MQLIDAVACLARNVVTKFVFLVSHLFTQLISLFITRASGLSYSRFVNSLSAFLPAFRKNISSRQILWNFKPIIRSVSGVLLLSLTTSLATAGEFSLYGPESFDRQSGTPVQEQRGFNTQPANTDYFVRIHNGNLDDDKATAKASSTSTTVQGNCSMKLPTTAAALKPAMLHTSG